MRPESKAEAIAFGESSVIELADKVVEWSNAQLKFCASWSIDDMLLALGPEAELHHQSRTLAICLHLLNRDFDKAQYLCRQAGDQKPLAADGGGFTTGHPDGTRSTFNQQALEWIAQKRRKAVKVSG